MARTPIRMAALAVASVGLSVVVSLAGCSPPAETLADVGGHDSSTDGPGVGDVRSDTTHPDGRIDGSTDVPVDVPSDVPVDGGPTGPVALWQLPRSGPNKFALPWPSDLTLTADGFVDFNYIPNNDNTTLVTTVSTLDHVIAGFSPVAATYFRFSTTLDTTTLPATAADWLADGSLLQIIDIDPASPEHGQKRPGQIYYRDDATHYWPGMTLAIAPAFGFPLRERTRYAVVVLRGVKGTDGTAYDQDADLAAVLASSGGDAQVAAARTALAPALAELTSAGVTTGSIVSLAVFTTQDCTGELFKVTDAVRTTSDPPQIRADIACQQHSAFDTCTGHYGPSPIYQAGALPYGAQGSGGFTFDATGTPIVDHVIDIKYGLAIPKGAPPQGGWPLVIYAHGTGGDATSHFTDGTAGALAAVGLASIGFDQIFNGERITGQMTEQNAELQFFNFLNIAAGRTNNRQAAVDLVQMGRLLPSLAVPAAKSPTGADISFNSDHVSFFGHSQGGLNGPLWFAAENGAGAGVFSGAGATLSISLVQKTEPVNIPNVVGSLLGIPTTGTPEIVSLHPVITLLQTAVDVEDPVNYGRYIVREPRAGVSAKHVYQTQGFVDHYAPPDGIATLALATGLQLVKPVLHPVDNYDLNGVAVGEGFPVSLNLANGTITGVWQQWDAPAGHDGHFVIFDVPAAQMRAANFLASFAANPSAPVIP
jgi:hypothetical protein